MLERSVRQRVVNILRPKFKTIEEAEKGYGLTIDTILDGDFLNENSETPTSMLNTPTFLVSRLSKLTPEQLEDVVKEGLGLLHPNMLVNVLSEVLLKIQLSNLKDVERVTLPMFSALGKEIKIAILDKLFSDLSHSVGLIGNCSNFVNLSIEAMKVLQDAKKHNLVYKWSQCIVGENGTPLIPLNRMPFGLIEYQLEFFTATNVMQVGVEYFKTMV